MVRKRAVIGMVAAAGIALAATYGLAFAQGWGGHGGPGHGDRVLGLLARAGGVSRSTIKSAFQAQGATLKSDFQTLHADKLAVLTCLIGGSPTNCTSQINAYQSAQQKLESDKIGVWQTIFSSPSFNPSQAQSTWQSLQSLEQQKRTLLKGIFGSSNSSNATPSGEGGPQS
jgi:hypothetical protein